MENIIVAVVSRDKEYNKAFAFALTNACREMTVKIYDNREFVRLWSDYDGPGAFYNNFDIILWAGEEISESYSDNIVYLADKPSLVRKDYKNSRFCLYRFEPARNILACIFEIYGHLTGRSTVFTGQTDVMMLGFSSCSGGTGCTTVSTAVAQELSRFYRKSIIYISLEDVESIGNFSGNAADRKNIGEYLYRLFGNDCFTSDIKTGRIPFLDSYLVRNAFGVEAFVPAQGKNPLRELNEEDMQEFIMSLMKCGRYDMIVVDLSSCLTDAGIAAMNMTDRICMVTTPGRSISREEYYLNQIECCSENGIMSKITKVINMCDDLTAEHARDEKRADSESISLRAKAAVRRFRESRSSEACEVLLEGGFGSDISHLTKILME